MADRLPQLNIHIPESSSLLERVVRAATDLGTTPSTLARVVLDVSLEAFVEVQLRARRVGGLQSTRLVDELSGRFSGPVAARPFSLDASSHPEGLEPGEPEQAPTDEMTTGASAS